MTSQPLREAFSYHWLPTVEQLNTSPQAKGKLKHLITSAEVRGPWVLDRCPKAVCPAPRFTDEASQLTAGKTHGLSLQWHRTHRGGPRGSVGHSPVPLNGSPRGRSLGPVPRVLGDLGDYDGQLIHPQNRTLQNNLMKSRTRHISAYSFRPHFVGIFLETLREKRCHRTARKTGSKTAMRGSPRVAAYRGQELSEHKGAGPSGPASLLSGTNPPNTRVGTKCHLSTTASGYVQPNTRQGWRNQRRTHR